MSNAKRYLFAFLSGVLVLAIAVPASASSVPVYVKLPMGTKAVVTLIGDGGNEVFRTETDSAGQAFFPEGAAPGEYKLRLEDVSSSNVFEESVSVMDNGHGLVQVLRPRPPWLYTEDSKEERAGFMTPKVFLLLVMMFCCLMVMILILHKKGMLRPLVEKLRPSRNSGQGQSISVNPSRTFKAPEPPKSAASVVEGQMDIKSFKKMEKALAKGKQTYTLKVDMAARASDWNRELGDLVLLKQRYAGGVGGVYEGYGTADKNRRLAIKMPLSITISKPNNRNDLDSIKSEFDNNHDMGGSMRLLQFYELRQMTVDTGQPVPIYLSVMEYVDGLSLRELIELGRKLDIRQRRLVMREVLEAMYEAHSKAKIHNDIKPENVLVNFDHSSMTVTGVKLIDFGAQVVVKQDDPARATKLTPDYCAPEVLGGGFPSVKSDIYAAGLMFYELFENSLPFPRNQGDQYNASPDEFQLKFTKLADEPALQRILANMTIKSTSDRIYEDVGAILSELR